MDYKFEVYNQDNDEIKPKDLVILADYVKDPFYLSIFEDGAKQVSHVKKSSIDYTGNAFVYIIVNDKEFGLYRSVLKKI